jgi:Uma2 family endonuclease
MPVVAGRKLTKEEFHTRYDGEEPYYEYWDGEVEQKATPKSIHGLVQKLLTRLLDDLGYESACEVEIHLDPSYEPVPDVIAAEGALENPYPTKPFEVVIEILSPDDQFSRVPRQAPALREVGDLPDSRNRSGGQDCLSL